MNSRPNSTTGSPSFTFIDLFAGIGGIRLPFDELGGECVFSSEWDKHSQLTYEANHGEKPHGDITQIPPRDIPKHDLLLAGFPCQAFSQAGLKQGFHDTRGTLFFYVANILNHHRPAAVLLENVKRFRTHDKGNTLRVVTEIMEELGYTFSTQVLSAKDFGVPQNRERIYMVGLLNGQKFEFPKPPKTPTRVGDILEKGKDLTKYTLSDELWKGHLRRKREHLEKGNGFGYQLFSSNSPHTSTLSARYYKDGSEILIEQKGKNPRKVTPREAAGLMGYPSTFKIVVSDTQAYRQFGNSVCVPVIRAIAKELVPHIGQIKAKRSKAKAIPLHRKIPVQGVLLPA
jgi:DNA (cytosine-5)-methyltransferase 1